MKRIIPLSLAVVASGLSVSAAQAKNARPEKPNVLFLLVDDLGWQDIECYDIDEPTPYETPHLSEFAKDGVLFWQAYSPAPTSSPSRGAILSGKHPARLQRTHVLGGSPLNPVERSNFPVLPPFFKARLDTEHVIIPEAIREAGYVSGHVAKWHIVVSYGCAPTPLDHGFDWSESDIKTQHNVKPNRLAGFVDQNSDSPYKLDKNGYPTDPNNDSALEFMEANKDKPFFLYYAPWLVHAPIQTRSKALLEKYCKKMNVPFPTNPKGWEYKGQRNPYYGAMVETMDYYIGMMIDYLKTTDDPRWPGHKLFENTYVIFSSDNGGMEGPPTEQYTDNFPLDKGKINVHEGGIRVPFIISGPGIAKNTQSDVVVNLLDIYPTILSWTGSKTPKDLILDGTDLSTLLKKNPKDAKLVKDKDGKPRSTIFHHFPHSQFHSSIRVDNYKFIRNFDPRVEKYELYKLYEDDNKTRCDIEEMKNLAKEMPEKVKEMDALLTTKLESMDASMPYYNPLAKHFSKDLPKCPKAIAAGQDGRTVWLTYSETDYKVVDGYITYTDSGDKKEEEWFKVPGKIVSPGRIEATLPEGATHFTFVIVDDKNFAQAYPEVTTVLNSRQKNYTSVAIKAK